ncbi:MAG TPA: type II toxin-antitoxin system HicB family antitoxin [Terriglobales bacterium]|nr:type II toxin-antitoxin system HicB family antitoxin [Terriglobales bacterium]
MKNEGVNDVKHYLDLPYAIRLRKDDEGDWVARIEELSGCTAHGKTAAEAIEFLHEVQAAWLEDALAAGQPIPEPASELPSGKWLQRVPRSLHKKLVELAKAEEVSLNQLITSILAEAVGRRSGAPASLGPVHATELVWCLSDPEDASTSEWNIQHAAVNRRNTLDVLSATVSRLPDEMDENDFRKIEDFKGRLARA